MQEGLDRDSTEFKVMKKFSCLFYDEVFIALILFMSPFTSRERFWYYLAAIQFASFSKINLKMMIAAPRPVWVWSDLSNIGCSASFSSPSGQSTRSATFATLVILDHFFASSWSNRKYP